MGGQKGEQKRKAPAEADGGNKKRKYFQANKQAALPLGTRGFLVSCLGGKEYSAAMEAINLLTEYYAASSPGANEGKERNKEEQKDVSSAIAEEVAELKSTKARRFTYHKTNVNGLIYVSMDKTEGRPGPVELVASIASDAKATQQCRTRLCLRWLPIENVCYGSLEDIRKCAAALTSAHFPSNEDAAPVAFAVHYEHRASVALDRMAIIDSVIEGIKQPPHKVNLKDPQKTILVQLVKSSCGISVVGQFKTLAKFNLPELCTVADDHEGAASLEQKRKPDAGDDTITAAAPVVAYMSGAAEERKSVNDKTSDES